MRKLMLSLFLLGLLAVGLMPAAAAPSKAAAPTKTIAAIVAEQAANKKTPQFTTLLAALKAANLVETLSGPGPFTVFAPTDAAFNNLPSGFSVAGLIADPTMLASVLKYHVASGKVPASEVVKLTSVPTLEGTSVAVAVRGGSVFLNNNAQVITTDIEASNGIIHVIDNVLIPPYTTAGDYLAVVTSNQQVYDAPGSVYTGGTVKACQTFFVSQYSQGFFQLDPINGWVDARALVRVPANYGQVGGAPKYAGC